MKEKPYAILEAVVSVNINEKYTVQFTVKYVGTTVPNFSDSQFFLLVLINE